jgi:hypothetical protein
MSILGDPSGKSNCISISNTQFVCGQQSFNSSSLPDEGFSLLSLVASRQRNYGSLLSTIFINSEKVVTNHDRNASLSTSSPFILFGNGDLSVCRNKCKVRKVVVRLEKGLDDVTPAMVKQFCTGLGAIDAKLGAEVKKVEDPAVLPGGFMPGAVLHTGGGGMLGGIISAALNFDDDFEIILDDHA